MFSSAVLRLWLKMEVVEDTNKVSEGNESEIKSDPTDSPSVPEKTDEEKPEGGAAEGEKAEGEEGEDGEKEEEQLSEDAEALKEELDKIIVSPPEPQKV